ncbi:MAG: glycosyltransferase family 4 protein, partial [Myxococcales bacterium]|nr:glycosyltransferase family 4 protein [Myxococcales bacterium]
LFCLREHKYRTLGHETCTRTVGLGCYPCLGFVAKNGGAVELRTVGSLLREQETNHGFDAFVVGSSYMRDHVVAHGFESSRVHANPLFVEPQDTGTGTRDPFQILFVGALLRGKGLDVLLEAMAKVRSSAHLLVVGTGAQEALFREFASELGLAARVTFAGQLDRPSLARAYAESACLVVPSRSPETFGLTGPEAMLHGTPVIASAVGGMGEWLVDGVTGLAFPSGDAEALAGAIHRVLDNPEDAARMVAEGRRRCEENFRADAHVDRLLTVLEGVVRS